MFLFIMFDQRGLIGVVLQVILEQVIKENMTQIELFLISPHQEMLVIKSREKVAMVLVAIQGIAS